MAEAPASSATPAEASPDALPLEEAAPVPATGPALSDAAVLALGRIFQQLDDDHDGFLTIKQARVFLAAGGAPATDALLATVAERQPEEWRGLGYDFDNLVAAVEEEAVTLPLRTSELRALFGRYEAAPAARDPAMYRSLASPAVAGRRAPAPAARHTIPAYAVRHVLAGIPTVGATHLTNAEVDAIFRDFGIGERDPVDYAALVARLGGGMVELVDDGAGGSR